MIDINKKSEFLQLVSDYCNSAKVTDVTFYKKAITSTYQVTGISKDICQWSGKAEAYVMDVTKKESNQTAGTVLSQSIAGGSEVTTGTSVDLVIAAQPQAQGQRQQKATEAKEPPKKNESSKTR